ncbi:MAG: hypothetical protein ACK56I_36470, partial [bacterium]
FLQFLDGFGIQNVTLPIPALHGFLPAEDHEQDVVSRKAEAIGGLVGKLHAEPILAGAARRAVDLGLRPDALHAVGDGAPAVALVDGGEIAEAGQIGGVEFEDGIPALHEP